MLHRASITSFVAGSSSTDPFGNPAAFHRTTGSSISAPIAAGIGALTWRAMNFHTSRDPSAGDVERCMRRSGKFVDAQDSVLCALGEPPGSGSVRDRAPLVDITSPPDGQIVAVPTSVTLTAFAADENGAVNPIQWFVNGASSTVSTSGQPTPFLITAPGTFTILARATDGNGNVGSDSVTIFANPTAPGVRIRFPLEGNQIFAGIPVDLAGDVLGRFPQPCPTNAFNWSGTLNGAGVFSGLLGCSRQVTFSNPGAALITAAFSDTNGSGSALRNVNVVADNNPHVKIVAPQAELQGNEFVAHLIANEARQLAAIATPVGVPFTFSWYVSAPGIGPNIPLTKLPTTSATPVWTPVINLESCDFRDGTISVFANDALGVGSQNNLRIRIHAPTCD